METLSPLALDTLCKLSSHGSQARHAHYVTCHDSPNLGAIIGGAIGGLTVLILGLVVMRRRRKRQMPDLDPEQNSASVDPASTGVFTPGLDLEKNSASVDPASTGVFTPGPDLERNPASVDSARSGVFTLLKVYKVRNTF